MVPHIAIETLDPMQPSAMQVESTQVEYTEVHPDAHSHCNVGGKHNTNVGFEPIHKYKCPIF